MNFQNLMDQYFGRRPKLRKPRWVKCPDCGGQALDHTWGAPPKKTLAEWKGRCSYFGHGAGSCRVKDVMRLTTPWPDPKGRCCWVHKKPGKQAEGQPMSAKVTLFDPSTGVRIECLDEYAGTTPDENGDYPVVWQWTEGNYGCDCNKMLFMGRAGAPGYPTGLNEVECSDTIVLEKIVADDGRILFENGMVRIDPPGGE